MSEKKFVVAGVNWIAEVDLPDFDFESPQTEAATRAVEALYGKRNDITIEPYKPIKLTKKQKEKNELQSALIELLSDELVSGCRIGMLLCIADTSDKNNEWYISSKDVLENVGVPKLIEVFNKKYPTNKKEQTP